MLLSCVAFSSSAQQQRDTDLLQFSGFVVNYDSSKTIPFATIRLNGTNKGTYSDMSGYFSFVARKTDVIVFSCVGYKTQAFRFPDNIQGNKFNMIIPMEEDTFALPEYITNSYPSREEFDYYFPRMKIPEDELNLAYHNLRKKPTEEMANNMSYNSEENARWTLRQQSISQSYTGQVTPIRLLDPLAWAQFIKSLKKGDLKRK